MKDLCSVQDREASDAFHGLGDNPMLN